MKTYSREINGIEHTFQYSDEEAASLKEQGVDLNEVKDGSASNKAKTASNKSA